MESDMALREGRSPRRRSHSRRLVAALVALLTAVVMLPAAVPAHGASVGDRLEAGRQLTPGMNLRSGDGRFTMWMQHDGNLVIYQQGRAGAVWSTGTWGNPGARAVMQHDGNFVVYASTGRPLWNSATWSGGGRRVVLQTDGNLVIAVEDGRPLWSRTTGKTGNTRNTLAAGYRLLAGQRLVSPNGMFTAVMQNDGNFVVYEAGRGAKWSTGSWNRPGARLVMQHDGNLVLYPSSGPAIWNSGTFGTDGRRAVMQDDGNLVVYNTGTTARWSRVTGIIRPPQPAPPTSSAAEQAARWAEARVGQVTTAENWNIRWYASARYWSGWCETFVEAAYGRRFNHPNATAHFIARRNAGQIRQGVPPRGAVVFWSNGIAEGHVAISVGNGQVVGTLGNVGEAKAVSRTSYLAFSGYRGWAMP